MAEVKGVDGLVAGFKRLSSDMTNRTARVMVVAGGQILKTEAKSLAQSFGFKRTGALIKNIAIKRERTPAGTVQYNLGVRHGRDLTKKAKQASKLRIRNGRVRYADDPFYWRFLELGWIPRGRGQGLKGGALKKAAARERDMGRKIPGRSFIGDALKNKRDAAIDAMAARLQREIEKAGR